MIKLLSRIFIKNRENFTDAKVRSAYGKLCSITGIFLNIVLFTGKYLVGTLSGSIAITADAFNNLSDAGSSIITLLGFLFAGRKADEDHPFGHGRIEYLSGLGVSAVILLMGLELGISSFEKILRPAAVEFSWLTVGVLAASILVKLYMSLYNRRIGKAIGSEAVRAVAKDSLNDVVATSVVLISMIVMQIAGVNIDGYSGLFVAAFIVWGGIGAAKDTMSPLLGKAPAPGLVRNIEKIVLSHEDIVGIHDMIIHDYGPGRLLVSLHAEVRSDGDLLKLHDSVDLAERELSEQLGCEAVIHMDPIAVDDETVNMMKAAVLKRIRAAWNDATIHDFRMVEGPTHTNLIFDVVVPNEVKTSEAELKRRMEDILRESFPGYYFVITIDRAYVK